MKKLLVGASILIQAALLSGEASPVLEDPFSDLTNWEATGNWGLTSQSALSPPHSVTDSPGAPYANNSDTSLTLAANLDLTQLTRPALLFHHRYDVEAGYDDARVELSVDGGSNWESEALAVFSGTHNDWSPVQLDLAEWAHLDTVRLRFRLITDSSVTGEGWFVDDLAVGDAPAPPTLPAPASGDVRQNRVTFDNLSFSSDHTYRLYRSIGTSFDPASAFCVNEAIDTTQPEVTDLSVTPKRTYTYQLLREDSYGFTAWSNSVTVTTPSGTEFPFLDNGESGNGLWVAATPWALTDERARSGSSCWGDSPDANYADGIASLPLTLVEPVDLSQSTQPVLSFYHAYTFASGDSGHVEISTNGGESWDTLRSYLTGSADDWTLERIDLSAFTENNSVLIRFRLTSDDTDNAAGWYIDDISMAEAPAPIAAPALDNIESHQIRLQWNASTENWFSHYAIHRDSSDSVGTHSPLIATISDPLTTTYTDTGLLLDTVYHYRIYAVSIFGTYSDNSGTASSARTLNNPIPFEEDFSEDNLNWQLTGTWARTEADSYSGDGSLTDSPGQMYANNNSSSATTAVDLSAAARPVLTYYQHYELGTGDSAALEVSTNGTNWTKLYSASGSSPAWHPNQIDLSAYAGEANLRIRLTLASNNDGDVGDGWFIDAFSVAEYSSETATLPIHDDFAAGADQWITGGWTWQEDPGAPGGYSMADTPNGWIDRYTSHDLSYARPIDLTTASDPQVVCWYRGVWGDRVYLHLEVSKNGGLSWDSTRIVSGTTVEDWTRFQLSLADYTGETILLRLRTYTTSYARTQQGRIGAVTVQER
ncbi:MAG: hypothetical protein ACLFU4_10185, partial [Opitutales bacterium]